MSQTFPASAETSAPDAPAPAPPMLPDRLPVARHLDPAAALAYRTDVLDYSLSADSKAASVLTLIGIMFTVLARCSGSFHQIIGHGRWLRFLCLGLLLVFSLLSLGAVLHAFRTITPRFPKAKFSLSFFGDIARLPREEYIARVEALSADQAMEHVLAYNHTASVICVQKFQQVLRCLSFFRYAFACWLALVAMVLVRLLMHG